MCKATSLEEHAIDKGMISVLIRVENGPEALAATLGALVPAVAAGLLADAVVLASDHDHDLAAVADASGAALVVAREDFWRRGALEARKDWILCLRDGDIPQEGWIQILDRFITLGGGRTRSGRLRRKGRFIRLGLDWILCRFAPPPPRAGDLVQRSVLLKEAQNSHPVRLAATIARDPIFG